MLIFYFAVIDRTLLSLNSVFAYWFATTIHVSQGVHKIRPYNVYTNTKYYL